ncbi:MAG: hypothetical protein KME31_03405 [Tolypothrix carrinoi HA7290-LM1]|nr:hypothetical protein [Tolypothrix carrinoi HA7290-LM1]
MVIIFILYYPFPQRESQSRHEGNPPAALDSPLPITHYPFPIPHSLTNVDNPGSYVTQ